MILGLCGPKGSGKSTLAKELSQKKYFHRLGFSDPIKDMTAALLRIQGVSKEEIFRLVYVDKEEETEYLNHRSSRHCQVTLGTEWGRMQMDQLLWIGVLERRIFNLQEVFGSDINIVIEDLRFLNEAEMIRHHGGKIILISRAGYVSSSHISEREHTSISKDLIILNDFFPESMLKQLEMSRILS